MNAIREHHGSNRLVGLEGWELGRRGFPMRFKDPVHGGGVGLRDARYILHAATWASRASTADRHGHWRAARVAQGPVAVPRPGREPRESVQEQCPVRVSTHTVHGVLATKPCCSASAFCALHATGGGVAPEELHDLTCTSFHLQMQVSHQSFSAGGGVLDAWAPAQHYLIHGVCREHRKRNGPPRP